MTYIKTVGAAAISDALLSLLQLSEQHKVSGDCDNTKGSVSV
jgi:hypothetical protein